MLTAVINPVAFAAPRTRQVTIDSPGPGGGVSASLPLAIVALPLGPPVLTAILPSAGPLGFAGGNLTLDGSGFTSESRVNAEGAELRDDVRLGDAAHRLGAQLVFRDGANRRALGDDTTRAAARARRARSRSPTQPRQSPP